MYIIETESGVRQEVDIELVSQEDFEIIRKLGKFNFDWDEFQGDAVYKLVPIGSNDMAGLMALVDHPDQLDRFTEIKLLESAAENIGAEKKFDRVAGTLISFACKEAFKQGYDGWVFLIPKSKLVPHYIEKYRFHAMGRGLALDTDASAQLIAEYQ